ncbi:hypothetical protein PR202_ga08144 [Eleusine coracana subsp. coracana]|uniref:Uncharacterized protein n=1 Tax=Eleusine coracana subsp. coracana TaxID=191504 RepID=A0AAV5C1U2_ELECO|nr:hypothetical protein PR202_ga08144 [Eleusine coracana subsp. coracana]
MEAEAETDRIIISPSPEDTTTATGGEAKALRRLPHHQDSPLARRTRGTQGSRAWIHPSLLLLLLILSSFLFSKFYQSRADLFLQSLCNACGIRYRKRRRQALGLEANAEAQDQQQKKNKEDKKKEEGNKKEEGDKKKEKQVTVELRVVSFGKEVMLKQRRRMRRKKCLSEEERAAVLLMALSSGVIYAS